MKLNFVTHANDSGDQALFGETKVKDFVSQRVGQLGLDGVLIELFPPRFLDVTLKALEPVPEVLLFERFCEV